jgi:hypothetical protein
MEHDYKVKIDVSQLSSGLHFIQFEMSHCVIHKSLLKQ